MVLDVRQRLQRKTYLFARAYGRLYLRRPLGRYLPRILRPGDTFLDIGSNVGFYAIQAGVLVGPRGRVWAFEPDPATAEAVRRTAAHHGLDQVKVMECALSDQDGSLTFHVDPNGLSSSLVAEAPHRADRYHRDLEVRVTSLNGLVQRRELALERVRLVKVDVEGEEPRTVAGMLGALETLGRPPVWCEVRGPRGSTRAPDTYTPVAAILAGLGYAPYCWNGRARPLGPADLRRRGSFDVLFSVGAPPEGS
jgi:FkbM family methyltransferase